MIKNLLDHFSLKLDGFEKTIVKTITLSSSFEWFQFFHFYYWLKVFEGKSGLFGVADSLTETLYAILLLSIGLLARPLGGVLFGMFGDRIGRKLPFMLSLLIAVVPSLFLFLFGTFTTWAITSMAALSFLRLLQGIPAGGELPAALCILYETSDRSRTRYLCSYFFVGPQLGQILSLLLFILFQTYLDHEQLIEWGWKLSFGISTAIGILWSSIQPKLLKTLPETYSFRHLEGDHLVERHPVRESLKHHKKMMVLVLLLSIFEVTGFYLIYYYIFENPHILQLNRLGGNILYLVFLFSLTIVMPLLGGIRCRHLDPIERIFKVGAWGIFFLSIPFFFGIREEWPSWLMIVILAFMVLFYPTLSSLRKRFSNLCFGFIRNGRSGHEDRDQAHRSPGYCRRGYQRPRNRRAHRRAYS